MSVFMYCTCLESLSVLTCSYSIRYSWDYETSKYRSTFQYGTNKCVCMCVEGFTTIARSEQVQTYNYTNTIHTSTTRVFESHWTGKKVIRARLWTWRGRERERRALKQKNWWLTKLPKTPLLPSRLTGNGMFSFFFPSRSFTGRKAPLTALGSCVGWTFVCGTVVSLPQGSGASSIGGC